MAGFKLVVNSRVEIIIGEEEYKSVIQDVNNESFFISMPMEKGEYIEFDNGSTLVMYNYTKDGNYLYKFTCKVKGRAKSGLTELYELSLPEKVERIQRREFVRIHVVVPIEYKIEKNEDNKFLKGILVDISGGGLRFATDNKINVGEVIELKLRDINTEDEILIKGQCVRLNKESNGKYICAVSYYEMSNKIREKIIESIFTLMRKQMAIR